jgi:pimeloyl-ACP methyl ester carboxylesterase/DNA-binding CsgD family transcriptional regulator
VRIAYFTLGVGPPLIHMPPLPLSHIRVEWQGPSCRPYYEALAVNSMLIRYDRRGAGLSDPEAADLSIDAHIRDLEAVADQLSLERFALLGFSHSGPAAIAFAARHPERVSHLILWNAYANAGDYSRGPRVEAARSLIGQDWQLYTETEGYRFTDWSGGEDAKWYTEYLRASVTPEGLSAAFEAIRQTDVRELLSKVEAPTLVVHRSNLAVLGVEPAKELASRIPNARLVLLDGVWIAPFMGGSTGAFVGAVKEFLGDASEPRASTSTRAEIDPKVLTPRETEILRLIAAGRSSGDVSRELSLSVRTVGRHITNIYGKIGARTRADATAYAIRHGLI